MVLTMRRNRKILLTLLLTTVSLSMYIMLFNEAVVDQQLEDHVVYQMFIKENGLWLMPNNRNLVLPHKTVRQPLQQEALANEQDDGYFPVDGRNVCPYLGLTKIPYKENSHRVINRNSFCKTRKPTKEECIKAYDIYHIGKNPLSCSEKGLISDLCTIKRSKNESSSQDQVKCDLSACGKNPVFVASIDPVDGQMEKPKKWKRFTNAKELEKDLLKIIIVNTKNGINFCFLQCSSKDGKTEIKTLLSFPPQDTKTKKQVDNLFNINVLVLDSVSRAHFYRSLPKTVMTLREISYEKFLNVTVLDYQLMQALAPYTYTNIKAFFTGNSLYHAEHAEQLKSENQYYYGFDLLYKKLKKKGFYTIFQEDLCWLDKWGTILGNTKKKMMSINSSHERKKRWKEVIDLIRHSNVDNTGVTHATCEVLKQYNVTNQFNEPPKICYGAKPFVQYFLEYLEKSFSHTATTKDGAPVFAYNHFNIGHEVTGLRVRQIDEGLSKFLRKAAKDQNTLTILFSDHGPKTTQYATHSIDGMYETFSPFLFILLPKKIVRTMDRKRIKNLIMNQDRLVTLKDLNGALTYIIENDISKAKERTWRDGLFSEIPVNRSCEIFAHKTGLCVCSNYETWFPDNHPDFTWIAEFALGEINNEIQRTYTKRMRGKISLSTRGGFGNCQKLVGINFAKVRQTKDKKNIYVSMHITTNPFHQIFAVTVKYPKSPPSLKHKFQKEMKFLKLLKYRRLTTYQYFFECKDEDVDIQLCVCKIRKLKGYKQWKWVKMNSPSLVHEVMRRQSNFGANQIIQNLDGDCLYVVTRLYNNNKTLAYEIVNTCEKRMHVVQFSGKSVSKVITSVSLPFKVKTLPLTIQFVLVVYHFRKPLDFTPSFFYKVITTS